MTCRLGSQIQFATTATGGPRAAVKNTGRPRKNFKEHQNQPEKLGRAALSRSMHQKTHCRCRDLSVVKKNFCCRRDGDFCRQVDPETHGGTFCGWCDLDEGEQHLVAQVGVPTGRKIRQRKTKERKKTKEQELKSALIPCRKLEKNSY
jgi:hypothetical protein